MDLIAKIFGSFTYLTWWIAGLIMIVSEIFVGGAFLLWLGVSAFFVGLLMFFGIPLNWLVQIAIFSSVAIASIILFRKYQKNKTSINDTLSHRADKYIGKIFVVVEPVVNGSGKIKIEDTVWRALSEIDIEVGKKVKIISVKGASFTVEPA